MSRKNSLINPEHLFIWFSIYMITAIPAYYKIYQTIPIALVIILTLEEIASYYILDERLLDAYMDSAKHQSKLLMLLMVSVVVIITGYIWLLFNEWKLCALMLGADIICFGIKKLIDIKKSSRGI
ncbi:hypothetical protein PBV87_15075 [Niameybacter massiliensis]|uniref:Uncharacterized protein n=1 Tax=Holtiella tumoricola TaxID=3018743 RepID=A0AA42J249_9FIRM|nr:MULTISPECIES: hypothetical protein [Lachnospirales]MDA3732798.1 hypothetical protein [Holtiella tumoricola]